MTPPPLQRLPTEEELPPVLREPRSLGEAVARVVHAGERLIAQRAELIRLEARNDVRALGTVVALAVGGGLAGLSAVVVAIAAVGVAVVPAIPLSAYLAIVAGVFAGGAGLMLWGAKARLPQTRSETPKMLREGEPRPMLGHKE